MKQIIQRMAAQVNTEPKGKNTTTKILDGKPGNFSASKAVITNKIPRQFSQAEVSILLLKLSDTNAFEDKLSKVKRLYPAAPVIWNGVNGSVGKALNRMISEVKTEYFFVLEADAVFSKQTSEGIATLWDALERYPEIDFVGGSYLSGDKLYVSCQRFRLCAWTFSESYEYERSLGNIMICDGTSASFMGRKESMKKIRDGFDEKMSDMLVVKDFFVRAKQTAHVVVATRPSFILLKAAYKSMHEMWQSHDITKDLLAFALKYKVLVFKDEDGNTLELCGPTSPLRGKDVCIERNTHNLMLNGRHWAYDGLYTYPFLLGYLKVTLREVTNFFEKNNISYMLDGGVSLGAVKMRSILPWEAGDLDIGVYGISLSELLAKLKTWGDTMGYTVRQNSRTAIHVFCTPKDVGDVSGGLATIFLHEERPPEYLRIKTNGIWVRYAKNFFEMITREYGEDYLQHMLYNSHNVIRCAINGHNACLPDFKTLFNGYGGTYREYFCES